MQNVAYLVACDDTVEEDMAKLVAEVYSLRALLLRKFWVLWVMQKDDALMTKRIFRTWRLQAHITHIAHATEIIGRPDPPGKKPRSSTDAAASSSS